MSAVAGVALACIAGALVLGCSTAPSLVPDTTVPGGVSEAATSGIDVRDATIDPLVEVQGVADTAMAAMGDAYRSLAATGKVDADALAMLEVAFSSAALSTEEANLRDVARSASSLAAAPGNPLLTVIAMKENRPGCQVVTATFDDRPLLAFPGSGSGTEVVARLERTERWRISFLAAADKVADGSPGCG